MRSAPARVPYLAADPALVAWRGAAAGGAVPHRHRPAGQSARRRRPAALGAARRLRAGRRARWRRAHQPAEGRRQRAARTCCRRACASRRCQRISPAGRIFLHGYGGGDRRPRSRHLDRSRPVAHLAGALGRPVFVALKQVPEWRWRPEGERSDWYLGARCSARRGAATGTNCSRASRRRSRRSGGMDCPIGSGGGNGHGRDALSLSGQGGSRPGTAGGARARSRPSDRRRPHLRGGERPSGFDPAAPAYQPKAKFLCLDEECATGEALDLVRPRNAGSGGSRARAARSRRRSRRGRPRRGRAVSHRASWATSAAARSRCSRAPGHASPPMSCKPTYPSSISPRSRRSALRLGAWSIRCASAPISI